LHYWLDEPLSGIVKRPLWFRYADNLCYLAGSVPEGERVLATIRRRLRPLGLTLKGEDGVSDLRTGDAQILGFTLKYREGVLVYGLGKTARDRLRENLRDAYEDDDPTRNARAVLEGWIASYGPAFETGGIAPEALLDDAAKQGFRELVSLDEVRRWIRDAAGTWSRFRERNGRPRRGGG
jgi:hypothetical protein